MPLFLRLSALGAILFAVQALFRRAGPWPAWAVFVALPIALTPFWFRTNPAIGLFPWVKLYTILLSVNWITALRFTTLGERPWARFGMYLLLVVNIIEACTQDFFGEHLAHYLVLLSGVLLILQLPNPCRAISIDAENGRRELLYRGLTREWCVEYTLWNWAFVYLNYPAIAGRQFAVLAAALLVGLGDPRRWLQARGYTLAAELMLLPTLPNSVIPPTDTSSWSSPYRENVVAAICVLLIAVEGVRLLRARRGGAR